MLSELSIDWLGFGRSWLIRWRSLRFAESIFDAMVLGSMLMIINRCNICGNIENRSTVHLAKSTYAAKYQKTR
jgi:hypothetical protein